MPYAPAQGGRRPPLPDSPLLADFIQAIVPGAQQAQRFGEAVYQAKDEFHNPFHVPRIAPEFTI